MAFRTQYVSDSTSVKTIAWDSEKKEIIVVFHSGAAYAYETSEIIWEDFQAAHSKGKYVHAVLKHLPSRKLTN